LTIGARRNTVLFSHDDGTPPRSAPGLLLLYSAQGHRCGRGTAQLKQTHPGGSESPSSEPRRVFVFWGRWTKPEEVRQGTDRIRTEHQRRPIRAADGLPFFSPGWRPRAWEAGLQNPGCPLPAKSSNLLREAGLQRDGKTALLRTGQGQRSPWVWTHYRSLHRAGGWSHRCVLLSKLRP
jgi:hypothetical protein